MLNVYMDDVDDDTWEKICQISYHTLGVVHFILDEKKLTIISLVVDDHWWQYKSLAKQINFNGFNSFI